MSLSHFLVGADLKLIQENSTHNRRYPQFFYGATQRDEYFSNKNNNKHKNDNATVIANAEKSVLAAFRLPNTETLYKNLSGLDDICFFDVSTSHQAINTNSNGGDTTPEFDVLIDVALLIFARGPFPCHRSNDNNPCPFLSSSALSIGVSAATMRHFIETVRYNYFDTVPFHNFRHAVTVLQTLHCLFVDIFQNKGNNCSRFLAGDSCIFSPQEIFVTYIASLCHDLQHPGVDNNLLTQLNDPLAMRYNYNAILEQHHCSCTFSIIDTFRQSNKNQEMDIFANFNDDDNNNSMSFEEAKKMIAFLIGATEVPKHDVIKKNIEKLCSSNNSPTKNYFALPAMERRDLLCGLLEAADISTETRSAANFEKVSKRWAIRVTTEFFRTGDVLRNHGKVVFDAQNRQKGLDLANGQKWFTNFMCKPMYDALDLYFTETTAGEKNGDDADFSGNSGTSIFRTVLSNFKVHCETQWPTISKEECDKMLKEEEERIELRLKNHRNEQQQQVSRLLLKLSPATNSSSENDDDNAEVILERSGTRRQRE